MTGRIEGMDRWGGGKHDIRIEADGPMVGILVHGNEANGEALITPGQARALAKLLLAEAELADNNGSVVE